MTVGVSCVCCWEVALLSFRAGAGNITTAAPTQPGQGESSDNKLRGGRQNGN